MRRPDRPILVIEKLQKVFKRTTALRGIDIILEKPGVYGFLGPNGAGKSTTFRLIAGLLRPTAGRVLIDGADVQTQTREAVSKLGVQFDTPAFYPHLSGRDNLRVIERWLGKNLRDKIDELLDLVGLSKSAGRRVGGYSWGMKQRLGLAAALLPDPLLLLLDEPTNGLDPAGIADIRRLLPTLAQDQNRTVFLSSHRMDEVEQICDHVTIIHEGELVAGGTPADLAVEDNLIEVHCADPRMAIKILKPISEVVKVIQTGPDRIEVFSPKLKANRINQFLIDQGVVPDQVIVRRESLEDVFFRLTGAGNVTGGDGATDKRAAGVPGVGEDGRVG